MSSSAESNLEVWPLLGPTAVGKTALAHALARRRGAEILSADAMAVYRGMDIGTAKPTAAERAELRYHGIDIVDPDERFDVARYRQGALEALRDARRRGRPVLLVGGTGLYVKGLTHGLDDGPPHDPERRRYWEARGARDGVAALAAELQRRAPAWRASPTELRNPRRVIRALECVDAGLTAAPRGWAAVGPLPPMPALTRSAADLAARIAARVAAMYAGGLLDEARRLLDGPPLSRTARQAIGYAEALAVLRGETTVAQAADLSARRTRQLARRQRTWFRGQASVAWIELDPGDKVDDIMRRIESHWEQHGPTRIAG